MRLLEALAGRHHGLDLLDRGHLRQGHDESVADAALRDQLADEEVERAQSAPSRRRLEALEPDAVERWRLAGAHGCRHRPCRGDDRRVLLLVGPVAVAVLEVDAQVFDRLGGQLGEHPVVDGAVDARLTEDGAQLLDAAAIARQCLPGLGTPVGHEVGGVAVSGDVDGVHRLPHTSVTRIACRQVGIRRGQMGVELGGQLLEIGHVATTESYADNVRKSAKWSSRATCSNSSRARWKGRSS